MEQNKIIIDRSPLFFEIDCNTFLDIIVPQNTHSKISIIGTSDYNINIKVLDYSSLTINSLNKDNSVNINVSLYDNAKLIYNHSVLAESDSLNTFRINHLANSSVSVFNNNGINKSNKKLFFHIDGIIPKDLHNITCNQSSRIINFAKGSSKIIPNLIIDSNDIVANHSAYIGEIDEEELFYMKSRGISDDDIRKLIYRAALIGKMEMDEEKEKYNKILNEWW